MPKLISLIATLLVFSFFPSTIQSQLSYNHEIKQAASNFITTLNPLQKKMALLAFNDTARIKWNNLPVGLRARAGINIGSMSEDQRKILHRILSVSLSSQGYLKATGIFHLDNLLNWYNDSLFVSNKIDSNRLKSMQFLKWSHRNFYLAFFGSPLDAVWGYKIEGHHLSVNFTFTDNKISVTPFFIGTDPAEYRISEYAGWRVLGQEEDLGLKLINLFSQTQQQKATMSKDVPRDIITGAETGIRLIDYWGIRGSEMTNDQQAVLKQVIREFIFNMEFEKATMEYDKILKDGIDKIYFGWIGPYEEKKPHYFLLNGPTFIIEFANSSGNHIHAIWREKGNEYGEDVLRQHLLSEKH